MSRALVTAAVLAAMCAGVQAAQNAGSFHLAMGPDPGGKTGEGVTSETTRTDHAKGDKAIQENAAGDRPRPQSGQEATESKTKDKPR